MDQAFFRHCAALRDDLLRRVASTHCVNPNPPALVLERAVQLAGYRIQDEPDLGKGTQAEVDLVGRVIYRNPRFSPDSRRCSPAYLRQAVAHELGHVMLHADPILAGVRTLEQELEADAFARVFLLPEHGLQRSRRLAAIRESTGRARSNQVAGLAADWWVTVELAWVRLRELGVMPEMKPSAPAVRRRQRGIRA